MEPLALILAKLGAKAARDGHVAHPGTLPQPLRQRPDRIGAVELPATHILERTQPRRIPRAQAHAAAPGGSIKEIDENSDQGYQPTRPQAQALAPVGVEFNRFRLVDLIETSGQPARVPPEEIREQRLQPHRAPVHVDAHLEIEPAILGGANGAVDVIDHDDVEAKARRDDAAPAGGFERRQRLGHEGRPGLGIAQHHQTLG